MMLLLEKDGQIDRSQNNQCKTYRYRLVEDYDR